MTTPDELRVPRHPIGVVAERTGLTPDVLRVWERRYGVVTPARGDGGQRLYSDADVERLRLLHLASSGGRSIGQVAQLTTDALVELVEEDDAERVAVVRQEPVPPPVEEYVADAFRLTLEMKSLELEALLRRVATTVGVWSFLETVAAPLLRRIGDGWHAGQVTTAQEHLASAAIRRILLTTIDPLLAAPEAGTVVVTTPATERHEMGALLAAAAAALEGWRVTYLGADLPAQDIADAAVRVEARAVALSLVYVRDRRRVLVELQTLREALPAEIELLVGGAGAVALGAELARTGIHVLPNLAALRMALRNGDPL